MYAIRSYYGNSIGLPQNLITKLREYQKTGYSWLGHLRENGFGGCLADDMGLGKTVQVLAGMLKSKEEDGSLKTEEQLFTEPEKLSYNFV